MIIKIKILCTQQIPWHQSSTKKSSEKKKKETPFLHGKSGLDNTYPVIVVIIIESTVPIIVTKIVTP